MRLAWSYGALRGCLGWVVVLFCVQPALAQVLLEDEGPKQALQCLQHSDAPPSFVSEDLARGADGLVRVKLTFDAPDAAPRVEVLLRAGTEAMVEAVDAYLRTYRLPCMAAGKGSVSAVQSFVFTARGMVDAGPVQALRKAPSSLASCLRTPATQLALPPLELATANLIYQAWFSAGNGAPEVKLVYSTPGLSSELKDVVRRYLTKYRLPCVIEGEVRTFEQHFQLRAPGRPHVALKEAMPLGSFLGSIKGIESERVRFDFGTMACPFNLSFNVLAPAAAKNRVDEFGEPNPNRLEFLAWLEGLRLALSPEQLEEVLGTKIVVQVPCGVLSLNAAETPR